MSFFGGEMLLVHYPCTFIMIHQEQPGESNLLKRCMDDDPTTYVSLCKQVLFS